MKNISFRILLLSFAAILVSSCITTDNVPKGEYLYTKSSYSIKGQKIKNHNIPSFYKQKQNKRVLFARPWVWVYDVGMAFKDGSKIQHFLCDIVGEKPILYDSTLVKNTAKNIRQHMNNLGYYNAEIFTETTLRDSLKMAKVKYIIYPNPAYYLRKISFNIENKSINSFVKADWKNSKLDTAKIFKTENLKKERERITKDLQNLGFFYFSKKQITFTADSNFNEHRIDLTINIDPHTIKSKDSITKIESKQYKYNRVYIYPEVANNKSKLDTTIIRYNADNAEELDFYFIHNGPINVNPKSILNAIFIKPERLYREENIAYSYKALFNLSIYKYININIIDTKATINKTGRLDCIIELSKSEKLSINTESELKNTGGDYGIEQGVSLITRNTFKGGEVLNISLRGALEVQNIQNDNNNEVNKILTVFNTFEAGINASLDIPRFLAPVKRNFFSRYFNPKTRISLGYNYQDRPDYSRYIINANFGYTWIKNEYVSQILNPIELSSVKINPTDSFQETINNFEDPRIKYSYQDHLVLGMSYSYIYNERKWTSKNPFNYFFAKIDLGGIPFASISNLAGSTKDSEGQYWVMGLPYSQFTRFEFDYRHYSPMAQGAMMNVFRVNIGVGVPLFGSVAIPFEKSFFIGGANSLRAWSIGALGPGSYPSSSNTFEMTGDIKIEFNYEFRFPISEKLRGAIFTDIGNIYLLNSSDNLNKEADLVRLGAFRFDTFHKKLAANIGYGVRYDLSFLVLRFDIAHPIYQPYYTEGERWSMRTEGDNSKLIWGLNFAIGYPF